MNLNLPLLPVESDEVTPYPVSILRRKPWYSFVRQNGYAALAKRLMVKVYTDIESAQTLWNGFSPNKTLFDLWEIRHSFFTSYKLDPYFITLYEQTGNDAHILGVLPLWFEPDEGGKYQWFGGYWPEQNVFFVRDPEVIPLLLMVAPKPLSLTSICHSEEYEFLKTLSGYTPEKDENYYLDLTSITSLDDYLAKLKKKKRHNLKRDRKHIADLHPRIVYNDPSHLERMYELNIERFANRTGPRRDPSIFEHEADRELFRRMTRQTGEAQMKLISTIINGRVEAVEVGFIHNNVWYALTSGANIMKYSGIGVYSNILVIEEAIKHGCTKIDFLQEDHNWKEAWQLSSTSFYQFSK